MNFTFGLNLYGTIFTHIFCHFYHVFADFLAGADFWNRRCFLGTGKKTKNGLSRKSAKLLVKIVKISFS